MTTSESPTQEIRPKMTPWLSQNAVAFLLIANLIVSLLAFAKSHEASRNAYLAAQNATRAVRATDSLSFDVEQLSSSVRQLSYQRW